MNDKLSVSQLKSIVTALKEVSRPYYLGIQLGIESSILDEIERNHPGNIIRQKTEVIKLWLRNSPDASWTTLAKAVEGLEGHANLVRKLESRAMSGQTTREDPLQHSSDHHGKRPTSVSRETSSASIQVTLRGHGDPDEILEEVEPNAYGGGEEDPFQRNDPTRKSSRSHSISLVECTECNVVLLGKKGHGKSTLRNRLSGSDKSKAKNSETCMSAILRRSRSHNKDYKIHIYDHSGLFEGNSSIATLQSDIPRELNFVIFVLNYGCSFDKEAKRILDTIMSEWQIRGISALVLTHCESLSKEEREKMIEQFKKDHPSVAELMGKGILALGFPDSSHITPGSELSQRVEEDEKILRALIYSCEKNGSVIIPQQTRKSWYQQCLIS